MISSVRSNRQCCKLGYSSSRARAKIKRNGRCRFFIIHRVLRRCGIGITVAMPSFLVFADTVSRSVITLYYSALSARALLARSIFTISRSARKKNSSFKRAINPFNSTALKEKRKESPRCFRRSACHRVAPKIDPDG